MIPIKIPSKSPASQPSKSKVSLNFFSQVTIICVHLIFCLEKYSWSWCKQLSRDFLSCSRNMQKMVTISSIQISFNSHSSHISTISHPSITTWLHDLHISRPYCVHQQSPSTPSITTQPQCLPLALALALSPPRSPQSLAPLSDHSGTHALIPPD